LKWRISVIVLTRPSRGNVWPQIQDSVGQGNHWLRRIGLKDEHIDGPSTRKQGYQCNVVVVALPLFLIGIIVVLAFVLHIQV
jgi:hypothetical protein